MFAVYLLLFSKGSMARHISSYKYCVSQMWNLNHFQSSVCALHSHFEGLIVMEFRELDDSPLCSSD